jgi:signal transduction histidine kinase
MKRDERRLLLYFTLLIAALLVLGGVLLRGYVSRVMTADTKVQVAFLDLALRDRSRYLADTLADERAKGRWASNLEDILTRNHADYNRDIFMQVFEKDGRPVAASANTPDGLGLSDAALTTKLEYPGWQSYETTDPAGRAVRLVTYPVCTGLGTKSGVTVFGFAQAGLHMPETARAIARFTWVLVASLAGFGVLFVFGLRASVSMAASRMRLETDSMRMAQQRFIGDAAHELGTPLAVLRGEIDIALRRDREAGDYRAALDSCREEIERLSRLSENLLALATADAGQKLLHRAQCDAVAIAKTVHGRFARLAALKRINFTISAPDTLTCSADAIAIEQILGNLISNALCHTPTDESVILAVARESSDVVYHVTDTGEGIPPAHISLIFERFHRVDKARARANGGAGLGLAIVKTLVEAHGGTVSVESEIGKGTRFTVRIPVA